MKEATPENMGLIEKLRDALRPSCGHCIPTREISDACSICQSSRPIRAAAGRSRRPNCIMWRTFPLAGSPGFCEPRTFCGPRPVSRIPTPVRRSYARLWSLSELPLDGTPDHHEVVTPRRHIDPGRADPPGPPGHRGGGLRRRRLIRRPNDQKTCKKGDYLLWINPQHQQSPRGASRPMTFVRSVRRP